MGTLNSAFFFVIDKLVELQAFFWKQAWGIGRVTFLIALLTAAVNYAVNGQGLKDGLVKLAKATVFFFIIMFAYPRIIGWITNWTFNQAQASTYAQIEEYITETKAKMADGAASPESGVRETYGRRNMKSKKVSEDRDPLLYFTQIVQERTHGSMTYSVVAPAAAMEVVLLVAGECMRFQEEAPTGKYGLPDFGKVLIGLLCAFAVIFTGIFAVLEYLIAFLEFIFVTSVGVILFPLSLWEGSRFMSEKFVGAVLGFFIKLLFCNICIFLMLYGFISLARGYTDTPFTGRPDEIVVVLFVSLLFFYICKSAPALAQSLLTGTPSLSATGAISAMAGAAGAIAGTASLAGAAGKMLAGGAAKTAFAGGDMISHAMGAAGAAKTLGGGLGAQAGAALSSIGGNAKEALKSSGGELARSLLGGGSSKGGGGGSGSGVNSHSQFQHFLNEKNADGTKQHFYNQKKKNADGAVTVTETGHFAKRKEAGTDAGIDYMAKREVRQNKRAAKREARQNKRAAKKAGVDA